jgi:uncharacterized protein (TIGR03435 family)
MPKLSFFIACVLTLASSLVPAQAPADLGGRFARATITQNDKPQLIGAIFKDTVYNLVVMGAPLADVIARAYGVQAYQVVDAPAWAYEDHLYDIEAVPPPAKLIVADDTRMLRALLADRFGLRVYRGTRKVSMLVLEANMAKQRALAVYALPNQIALYASRRAPALALGGPRARYMSRRLPVLAPDRATASSVSTRVLVSRLTLGAGEPILDFTGLASAYLVNASTALSIPQAPSELVAEELARSGLGLEHRTVPLNVLVVTHLERPMLDVMDD